MLRILLVVSVCVCVSYQQLDYSCFRSVIQAGLSFPHDVTTVAQGGGISDRIQARFPIRLFFIYNFFSHC